MSSFFLAQIGVPTAGQCLRFLAPIAALVVLGWMLRNLDHFINRIFPSLEWQRQLGWLNICAELRASAVLRWGRHFVHALLAGALFGIVWGAGGLSELRQWRNPDVMRDIQDRLPILAICVGLWAFYLAGDLLPRLRREHEREELARFRAENPDAETEEYSSARTPEVPRFETSPIKRPRSRN